MALMEVIQIEKEIINLENEEIEEIENNNILLNEIVNNIYEIVNHNDDLALYKVAEFYYDDEKKIINDIFYILIEYNYNGTRNLRIKNIVIESSNIKDLIKDYKEYYNL